MDKKLINRILWISALLALLVLICIFSLHVGPAGIPVRKIFHAIFGNVDSVERSIVLDIRLPRIILGFAVGGALSLAGVILQGMFRNPLVEPYTLGISGGAALGVCLNLVLRLYTNFGMLTLPLFGFIGAVLVILLVYSLSLKKGIVKIQGLLLIGVMVSFISSSLIMFIMAVSHAEDLRGIVFWVMGSLEEPNRILVASAFIVSLIALAVSYLFSVDLNALSLGEEEAAHLGINTEKVKKHLFIIASLLTGFAVSIAGIIGFVGLVIPHFVRMFISRDHRLLLGASFLCGAAFLILCDTIARTVISPLELPVGVITGILGGSLFIYLLTKKQSVL